MKNHNLLNFLVLCTMIVGLFNPLLLQAQVPQAISYQTIIRGEDGNPLVSQSVSIKMTLHQETEAGTVVYCETHSITTNQLGLVNLAIGTGDVVSGNFQYIDWSTGQYYLEVELDPEGGTTYVPMGTTQLISVPYTLFSNDAARIRGNLVAPSIPAVGQVLQWNGSQWISATVSSPSCIDYDGNAYPTFTIGNQVWMAENLRVTHYRNGDVIPNVTDNAAWEALTTGAYSWNDNDQNENAKYGVLYNWYTVDDVRGLCPGGWHVPTEAEWITLRTYLGGEMVAGGKMKSVSDLWNIPNTDATNSSGFSGLPGGFRDNDGDYGLTGLWGYFWSTTLDPYDLAILACLYFNDPYLQWEFDNKTLGISVRCIKD